MYVHIRRYIGLLHEHIMYEAFLERLEFQLYIHVYISVIYACSIYWCASFKKCRTLLI